MNNKNSKGDRVPSPQNEFGSESLFKIFSDNSDRKHSPGFEEKMKEYTQNYHKDYNEDIRPNRTRIPTKHDKNRVYHLKVEKPESDKIIRCETHGPTLRKMMSEGQKFNSNLASTSTKREIMENFICYEKPMYLELDVKGRIHGSDINKYAEHLAGTEYDQNEFLVGQGNTIIPTGAYQNGNKISKKKLKECSLLSSAQINPESQYEKLTECLGANSKNPVMLKGKIELDPEAYKYYMEKKVSGNCGCDPKDIHRELHKNLSEHHESRSSRLI